MDTEILFHKITQLEMDNGNLIESNGRIQSKLDTYNDYLLPRATPEAKEIIDNHQFSRITIVPSEHLKSLECKNKELKSELEGLKSADSELIDEPIRIAEKLIYATKKCPISQIQKAFGYKGDMVEIGIYDKSDLRQIAKHLLVYCEFHEINLELEKEYEK